MSFPDIKTLYDTDVLFNRVHPFACHIFLSALHPFPMKGESPLP